MAAHIPRRPEVPGAPGVRLPGPHLVRSVYEELPLLSAWDDEAPTNPYSSDPPQSGTTRGKSLSVQNLSKADAAQLAGIIAAWEGSDPGGRVLLAEFAKRLARSAEK